MASFDFRRSLLSFPKQQLVIELIYETMSGFLSPKNFDFLFRLAGRNSLSISGRGAAREKHLKLLALGLMFIGQVKRPIWI